MSVSKGIQAIKVVDENGAKAIIPVKDGDATANVYGILLLGHQADGSAQHLLVEADGTLRAATQPASPPAGSTEFSLSNLESELNVGSGGDVSSPHTTLSSVLANGADLYLQSVEVGTAGDPSEAGSKVEVFWREGAGPTDHIIARVYSIGDTVAFQLPNTHKARDGTVLQGNGSNTYLGITRTRLSTAAKEIDAIVRGYTE